MRQPSKSSILTVLLLSLAVAALYGQTIGFERTYDDFAVVQPNEIANAPIDWSPGQRGLRQLSYRLDYALFGENFGPYHAQNLFWHVLTACLIAGIGVRLGIGPLAAFLGALYFAVHPAHVESVANLANRKEPMAAALVLLAFVFYLRSRTVAGPHALGQWLLAGALFLGAVYAKETAAVFPLALAAYEAGRRDLSPRRRFAVVALAGVVSVAIVGYVAVSWAGSGSSLETLGGFEGEPRPASIFLAAGRSFWTHLRLVVFPFGLTPDHRLALSSTIAFIDLLAWVAAIAAVAGAWRLTRGRPIARFAAAWALVFYLPTSSLAPVSYLVAERYLYLPSVGLAWLLAWGLERSGALGRSGRKPKRTAIRLGVIVVLVCASIVTASYTAKWKNESRLWTYVTKLDPDSARAWLAIGVDSIVRGAPQGALAALDRAIELRPDWARAYFNRSQARTATGDRAGAFSDLDRAVEIRPDYWPAFSNRGRMHWEDGDTDAALRDYDRAIRIHPGAAELYFNRGAVLALSGQRDRARADFERALDIDPNHAAARRNLEALGR